MRAARFLFGSAVATLVALSVHTAHAAALSETETLAVAAPDSAALAPPDSIFVIHPAKGDSIEARYVGYWSMGVRYRTLLQETGYLPGGKIRSIKDAKGNDYLERILTERRSYGSWGTGKGPTYGSWLSNPFRARSYRHRPSYVVAEFGISSRAGDGRSTGDEGPLYGTGIGAMLRLDPRWALGGVVQYGTDGSGYVYGSAGARVRRYLDDLWSLEGTLGLFADNDEGSRRVIGVPFFGELSVTAASAISVFTRLEQHHYSTTQPYPLPATAEVSETALHFGVRVGPRPAFLGVSGIVAGTAILFSGNKSETNP